MINKEIDDLSARLRWASTARKAAARGIALHVLAPPPGFSPARPGGGAVSVDSAPPQSAGSPMRVAAPPSDAEMDREAERLRARWGMRLRSRAPGGAAPRAADPWKPRDGSVDPWLLNGALPKTERDYRAALRARMSPKAFADEMEKRSATLRELRAVDAADRRAEAKRRAQRKATQAAQIERVLSARQARIAPRGGR
jgi:hypothetical protein